MKGKLKVVSLLLVVTLVITIVINIIKEQNYKKEENERIERARIAVEKANNSKNLTDIEIAKKNISIVETEEEKQKFTISIENLEVEIEKENIKNEFNSLLTSVEENLNQNELNSAIAKINEIEYEEIKEELLEKTKTIQEKITAEKKRLEQLAYYNRMKQIDATTLVSTPPSNTTVLETITGRITAFTPYCNDGCAGYTASGKFVGNGDIYQYDSEYGMVRIVAGDSSYPFGTIVRIKNLNYFGGDIYAMVLDRGGAIGKNKSVTFDLLFATEENANRFGVANNIECEILRLGY